MILTPALAATRPSPVVEAKRWIADRTFAPDLPLINVSQAAPLDPPPEGLRRALAEAAMTDDAAHLYGPVLGLPALREALAAKFAKAYGGDITPGNVVITQGCNQAFCAALATLAGPGDEVLLPSPWYFNHHMWLTMSGVTPVPLPTGPEMLPSPAEAEARITNRTRAIVLVTPNNPAGVEYPADLVAAFASLARARGIALVLDETYRDFTARPGAPHALFEDPNWSDTLIQLYSFSKAYRLTGHRVGSLIASPERLLEVEKVLDTVAICPNQLAQRAALWGLEHLDDWLADERAEILGRVAAIEEGFAKLPGWRLSSAGAYFAYAKHPCSEPSDLLAKRMVEDIAVLALPGTMFAPDGDKSAQSHLRFAIAKIDRGEIATLMTRLATLS